MNICLFTHEEIKNPLPKNDERAKHIIKVLHKTVGTTFDAGIIGGAAGVATITGISDAGDISFSFEPKSSGKKLYPLTLIIGFPRPIQLRRLLRDVAGLGVQKVILCGTDLTEKSYLDSNVVSDGSAYQMLLDGTAQAASTHVPELFMHATLRECLEAVQAEYAARADANTCAKIALDNVRPASSLHEFLYGARAHADCAHAHDRQLVAPDTQSIAPATQNVIAAIGSERGWTDKERTLLEQNGFVRCGMGARVLRTETAATVAGAIILDAMAKL